MIYCTAISTDDNTSSTGAGCTVYKTNKYLLITTYDNANHLEMANRITTEVAEDLMEKGYWNVMFEFIMGVNTRGAEYDNVCSWFSVYNCDQSTGLRCEFMGVNMRSTM